MCRRVADNPGEAFFEIRCRGHQQILKGLGRLSVASQFQRSVTNGVGITGSSDARKREKRATNANIRFTIGVPAKCDGVLVDREVGGKIATILLGDRLLAAPTPLNRWAAQMHGVVEIGIDLANACTKLADCRAIALFGPEDSLFVQLLGLGR